MPATEHAPLPGSQSTRIRVRVMSGARRSEVVGRLGDAWKVRVHAPPERGRANDEVVALLAGQLGIRTSEVRLVAGWTSPDKTVELDLPLDEAERRLAVTSGDSQ